MERGIGTEKGEGFCRQPAENVCPDGGGGSQPHCPAQLGRKGHLAAGAWAAGVLVVSSPWSHNYGQGGNPRWFKGTEERGPAVGSSMWRKGSRGRG